MASNVCPYKFIKNLATKTRFDNFSYQMLFWHNFPLIRHQKLIKNAKLERLIERQCVITLPMTFNSTWLKSVKTEVWNLKFDKNCENENDKDYFNFNKNESNNSRVFKLGKSHEKEKMCLRSEKRSKNLLVARIETVFLATFVSKFKADILQGVS